MKEIAENIIKWHSAIDRDLPWKNTLDPYFIWLSEIIMQQTRVAQGTPYYLKFVKLFPSVNELASASQEKVFKTWEGLGYYSRARNLHASAKYISEELNGIFPTTYDEIIKLKGVGPYTAAAISSFAFNADRAVLDGNVFRVLSRLFDIDTDILSSLGKKEFQILADELMPKGKSASFNQAIMDFGALVCIPANPNCKFCPVQPLCLAYKNGNVQIRPVKKKAAKKKHRYFHFLDLSLSKDQQLSKGFFARKRKRKDVWEGLFEFPNIHDNKLLEVFSKKEWEELIDAELKYKPTEVGDFKQTLSHQIIHATFFQSELKECSSEMKNKINDPLKEYGNIVDDVNEEYIYFEKDQLKELAFPRIINSYLEEYHNDKIK